MARLISNKSIISGIFCIGISIGLTSCGSEDITGNLTAFDYKETAEAFPNPMKGFRPTIFTGIANLSNLSHEYGRVYKHYIKYTDIEINGASTTVQEIKNWSNMAWNGIEKKNIKVIPRIYLNNPVITNNTVINYNWYWPADVPASGTVWERWTSSILQNRLTAFVEKLGQAWDNDSRVAAIEMGLWGNWGEHHIWPDSGPDRQDRIPAEIQEALGNSFKSAFKNKKTMIRQPDAFTSFQFGYYWDSFALKEEEADGNKIAGKTIWKTQMITGEVAYDWGEDRASYLGEYPNDTLNNNERAGYLIGWIKKSHASSLGWVDLYYNEKTYLNNDRTPLNAAKIQKAFGYRFVIKEAKFKTKINNNEKLNIELKVSNTGSAPFYYEWPVEISFLDSRRQPVFKHRINADIRSWQPDGTYTVMAGIVLPPSLNNKSYIIAAAILDPAGNQPSLRFANVNYYHGGRTPLGVIGIGVKPSINNWDSFDTLKDDTSLSYSLTQQP
jgi:hypothetical protein